MSVVLFEKSDRVAYVTLNRPEAMNAINRPIHERLCEIWAEVERDDDIDVAVVTGAGDDAFCAGMDLKEFVPEFVGAGPAKLMDWAEVGLGGLTRGYHWLDKPVIAAVNGWALAGGFELSLACDIRIASENAKFGSFEARRGFHHADGGIARLVNMAGAAVALEMLLTAEQIDAERAVRANIAARVVPHDKLLEEAQKTAAFILRNDQTSVRSAKKTALDMIGRQLDDQLFRECLAGYTLMADGADVSDRLQNFYDKSDRGRAGRNATAL